MRLVPFASIALLATSVTPEPIVASEPVARVTASASFWVVCCCSALSKAPYLSSSSNSVLSSLAFPLLTVLLTADNTANSNLVITRPLSSTVSSRTRAMISAWVSGRFFLRPLLPDSPLTNWLCLGGLPYLSLQRI